MTTPVKKFNLFDLEHDLIASFLKSRKIWVSFYKDILPEYFVSKNARYCFKAFKFYFDKYKQLPTQTQINAQVKKLAESGMVSDDFVTYVQDVYAFRELREDEVDYLYEEVHNFIKSEKIKSAILEASTFLDDPNKIKDIEVKIKEAVLWKEETDIGREISENIVKRYEDIEDLYRNGIATPWEQLNKLIGGQLFRKELTIFLAPSGVGKSLSLGNIATYARNNLGKRVVYITLELSELRVSQRLDASVVNVAFADTLKNSKKIEEKWNQIQTSGMLFIKEFATSSINTMVIKDYLYKLQLYNNFKPDIIIVDHMDAMKPNRGNTKGGGTGGGYMDGGSIAEELRGLAFEYNCPVVTGTQANRSGFNIPVEEFGAEHLGESMKKFFTADNLIALVSTEDDRANEIVHMKTIKTRNGKPNKYFALRSDYPYMRFETL